MHRRNASSTQTTLTIDLPSHTLRGPSHTRSTSGLLRKRIHFSTTQMRLPSSSSNTALTCTHVLLKRHTPSTSTTTTTTTTLSLNSFHPTDPTHIHHQPISTHTHLMTGHPRCATTDDLPVSLPSALTLLTTTGMAPHPHLPSYHPTIIILTILSI
mmetsp:Transcript_14918/g.24581  ORF Transcript_14918/g.24581 Transcript_14918/m.24581 type:complete len:156 (+) Transcript_14918:55-522(+)